MGMTSPPVFHQREYRWRNDDGDEVSATWAAALNTPLTVTSDSKYRLRMAVLQTNAAVNTGTIGERYLPGILYWSINGGPYERAVYDATNPFLTAGSDWLPVDYRDPAGRLGVADNGAYGAHPLNRTPGSFNYFTPVNDALSYTEFECVVRLNAAVAVEGDTVKFRVYTEAPTIGDGVYTALDSYDATKEPTMTVGALGPPDIAGSLSTQEQGHDVLSGVATSGPAPIVGSLATQEQGADTFASMGELGIAPIQVSMATQEQGPDTWGGTTGFLTPLTYQVQYWDEDTPETVVTVTDIESKHVRISGLAPAKNYGWQVRAYLSQTHFSDWTPPGLITTPTQYMDAQEVGFDVFIGVSQYQYLEVQEQGADVFAGAGELGALPAVASLQAQESTTDTLTGSGQVSVQGAFGAQEAGADTPTVTVTVTVTAVVAAQEELLDVLVAAGAVVVQASLQAQGTGQDTFTGVLEEVIIGVPHTLRVANVTRTASRFEWDAPA